MLRVLGLSVAALLLVAGCTSTRDEPAAPDPPLDAWMRSNAVPAVRAANFEKLAIVFASVERPRPHDAAFQDWTAIAGSGASAAAKKDIEGRPEGLQDLPRGLPRELPGALSDSSPRSFRGITNQDSRMDYFETFSRTLATCIDEAFDGDYGKTSCRREKPPAVTDEEVVISSIGFGAQHARGGIVLFATRTDTQALRPSGIEGASDVVDCDFVGELSNMIVGRLKNRFLARDVVLMLGTPITTIAKAARVIASTEPTSSTWFSVRTERGGFALRLDACFEPEFQMSDEASSSSSAGAEGDMLFF